MLPFKTPFVAHHLYPKFLWKVNTAEKVIYLTFDDGPIPDLTEWVLDTLITFEAKATFFCVGENVEKYPDIFQRIVDEGHSLGNHTQHHLNGKKTRFAPYLADVLACDESIQEKGQVTELFRPPYGRLTLKQKKHILQNKRIVMWDVLTQDYDQSINPELILQKSISATEKGSIVVFHDNLKAENNLKRVLPKYLDHFRDAGYSFQGL